MATYVTLTQGVAHLLLPIVLDTTPPDPRQADLQLKLDAAEAIILGYLKKTTATIWPTPAEAPFEVIAAILMQFAELTRFRGDDPQGQGAEHAVERGHDGTSGMQAQLSPAITNILRRLRDPALA